DSSVSHCSVIDSSCHTLKWPSLYSSCLRIRGQIGNSRADFRSRARPFDKRPSRTPAPALIAEPVLSYKARAILPTLSPGGTVPLPERGGRCGLHRGSAFRFLLRTWLRVLPRAASSCRKSVC